MNQNIYGFRLLFFVTIAIILFPNALLAQQTIPEPFAYPTKDQSVEQQQLATYYRAWTACMEGRGYTVN